MNGAPRLFHLFKLPPVDADNDICEYIAHQNIFYQGLHKSFMKGKAEDQIFKKSKSRTLWKKMRNSGFIEQLLPKLGGVRYIIVIIKILSLVKPHNLNTQVTVKLSKCCHTVTSQFSC